MNPFIRCVYQGADLSKSIVHQIKNRECTLWAQPVKSILAIKSCLKTQWGPGRWNGATLPQKTTYSQSVHDGSNWPGLGVDPLRSTHSIIHVKATKGVMWHSVWNLPLLCGALLWDTKRSFVLPCKSKWCWHLTTLLETRAEVNGLVQKGSKGLESKTPGLECIAAWLLFPSPCIYTVRETQRLRAKI